MLFRSILTFHAAWDGDAYRNVTIKLRPNGIDSSFTVNADAIMLVEKSNYRPVPGFRVHRVLHHTQTGSDETTRRYQKERAELVGDTYVNGRIYVYPLDANSQGSFDYPWRLWKSSHPTWNDAPYLTAASDHQTFIISATSGLNSTGGYSVGSAIGQTTTTAGLTFTKGILTSGTFSDPPVATTGGGLVVSGSPPTIGISPGVSPPRK